MSCVLRLMLVVILMLSVNLVVIAEVGEYDLTKLSVEALLQLRTSIEDELNSRGEMVRISSGEYLVGRDIAPGSYTITPYNGKESYNGWSWSMYVYRTYDSKGEYLQAEREHYAQKRNAEALIEAGKEATLPEEIDETIYKVFEEYYSNNVPSRVTLEEGQLLEVKVWSHDSTVELVIQKAIGLFMK